MIDAYVESNKGLHKKSVKIQTDLRSEFQHLLVQGGNNIKTSNCTLEDTVCITLELLLESIEVKVQSCTELLLAINN